MDGSAGSSSSAFVSPSSGRSSDESEEKAPGGERDKEGAEDEDEAEGACFARWCELTAGNATLVVSASATIDGCAPDAPHPSAFCSRDENWSPGRGKGGGTVAHRNCAEHVLQPLSAV